MHASFWSRRRSAIGVSCGRRAALYTLGSHPGPDDFLACARRARSAGCRVVAIACDHDDEQAGAPMLCDLMERLGEGEFEVIFGKAAGRHVVIEAEVSANSAVVIQ